MGDQLQISHQVADLATIVESHRPNQPIRDCFAPQRILEGAALSVGAIENCEFVQPTILFGLATLDLLKNEVGFITLVERGDETHRLPRGAGGAEGFALATDVWRDRGVGDVEDVGRRAIVLLEPNQPRADEFLLEIENVTDIRAAPAIDRLIVVPYDHNVAVRAAEQLDELKLGAVSILILVDEDELKTVAIASERLLVLAKDLDRQHQQIIEADCVGRAQRRLQLVVDLGRGARNRIHRQRIVFGGRNQCVLGIGNQSGDDLGTPLLLRDSFALHDPL